MSRIKVYFILVNIRNIKMGGVEFIERREEGNKSRNDWL